MAKKTSGTITVSKAQLEKIVAAKLAELSDVEVEEVETKADRRTKQKSRIARSFKVRSAEYDGTTSNGNPQFKEVRLLGDDGCYYKASRIFNNLDDAER